MKLNRAIRDFETQLLANGRSPHTVSSYLRDLGEFRAWLAGEQHSDDVRLVDAATLCRFATARCVTHAEDGRAKRASSVDKVKMSLRAFFRYLLDAGLIALNPARVLKYRRDHRVPEVLSDLEREHLRQMLVKADGWRGARDAAIVALFLGTGMRLASLVALDLLDVRLDERGALLRRLKGGGETLKALSEAAKQRLESWIAVRESLGSSSPALFLSAQRRRISSRQIQVIVQKRLREADIARRLTVHGLRHSFATALYVKTRDVLLVKRALDHRSVSSTLVYARVNDERVAAAIASI